MVDEDRLVHGLLRHERWAHNELYSIMYNRFEIFLKKRYGDIDSFLLEESINDGFLAIYNNIHQYSFAGTLSSWCVTVVENRFRNRMRNEKKWMMNGEYVRRPKTILMGDGIPGGSYFSSPDAGIDLELVKKHAKEMLSEEEYLLVTEHAEGYSYTELGEQLNKNPNNLCNKSNRASKRLKMALQDD